MSASEEAIYTMDEMYMLNKISDQIVDLKLEMAVLNERSEARHQVQLEMLMDIKNIKSEVIKHKEKIDSLMAIKNFIFVHWLKLLIAAAFVFSSVELHKFIHLPT